MRFITAQEIETVLSWPEVVDVVRDAMIEVSSGGMIAPPRVRMAIDDVNGMGMMPGAVRKPAVHGIKLNSLYPGNPKKGLSGHLGMMVLFDSSTGLPVALLEAGALTALRTPAATVLATQTLAKKDASVFAILGTGEQAHRHLDAFLECCSPREIRIWGRRTEAAEALAATANDPDKVRAVDDIRDAVTGADVITTVTSSPTPILQGEWLQPGQHVNLVGSSMRTSREIDAEGVTRLRFFVDSRDSASKQAGEYLEELEQGRISEEHIIGEIGEVLLGNVDGRTSDAQITGYKSLGVAAQDLVVSWAIAQKLGL